MNLFTLRLTVLTAIFAGIALVAASVTVLVVSAESSAGTVELLGIDTDITGNTSSSVGEIEVCSEMQVGEQREIDVVIKGVPESTGNAGALTGIDFSIKYDQRYVHIVGVEADNQFLDTAAGSSLVDFTDPVPDVDGLFRIALADFGTNADESGDGVLARITLEGIDVGTSEINFGSQIELRDSEPIAQQNPDPNQGLYSIDTIQPGLIAVGAEISCDPNATPPVPPTPSPTPVPTEPGESPGDTGEPTPVPTNPDGSTITPGPTNTSGPNGTTNPSDDNGGSSTTVIVVAVVVTAILLALAAAGFVALRRRGGTEA